MSTRLLLWALEQDDISGEAKFLLIVLAMCHNEATSECAPSQKFLAKKIGRSVNTVKRLVRELKDAGKISAEKKNWAGLNRYVFLNQSIGTTYGSNSSSMGGISGVCCHTDDVRK